MVQDQPFLFDPAHLQDMNQTYRARLLEEPGDISARLSLAWCLLFQSLYQSHQQAFWQSLLATSETEGEFFRNRLLSLRPHTQRSAQDARRLLKDSLFQAATASQLCERPVERADTAKIQELVTLLGEGKAVVDMERETGLILQRLARAIYSNREEHLGREEEEEEA